MYFRTASTDTRYKGVAFNVNGHSPNSVSNKLISIGPVSYTHLTLPTSDLV